MRIGLQDRIALMCDEESFVEFDKDLSPNDPLDFVDKKSYKNAWKNTPTNAVAQAPL